MKRDREETLEVLQAERFIGLLKLYESVEERVYTLLNKEEVKTSDIEDSIKLLIEVGSLVDNNISKKIQSLQRKKMYAYTKKGK
jgi:hypothetical protein